MLISIIIPAFNEAQVLARTIERILRAIQVAHDRGYTWEIVVFDNNSTDRTAEVADRMGARVVYEPINQKLGSMLLG